MGLNLHHYWWLRMVAVAVVFDSLAQSAELVADGSDSVAVDS